MNCFELGGERKGGGLVGGQPAAASVDVKHRRGDDDDDADADADADADDDDDRVSIQASDSTR